MQKDKQKPNIDPKKYYSVSQAADILGIHRTTLWRWVNSLRVRVTTRVVNNKKEFLGSELLKLYKHI